MTLYIPKPVTSTTFPLFQDGDPGTADAVVSLGVPYVGPDVTIRALFDALEWLKQGGGDDLSKHHRITLAKACARSAWSETEQSWYACGQPGAGAGLMRSQDAGRSWTDITAACGAAGELLDLTVSTAGTVVCLALGTRTAYVGVPSSYGALSGGGAWTASANALGAVPTTASVDYEPTAGNFVTLYRVGATGFRAEYDPDGIAPWTAALLPAAWSGYTGSKNAEIACRAGHAVGVFFDDGGAPARYRIIRSSSGGSSWAETTITPASFAPDELCKPVYSAVLGAWFFSGTKTAPPTGTEIFRSTDDGATWTSIAVLPSGLLFRSLAVLGPLLVAVHSDGRLFVSVDGVSWTFMTAYPVTTGKPFLRAGGGGLLALSPSDTWAAATLRFPGRA